MKKPIRHGGMICCDVVTVTETADEFLYTEQCDEKFVTFSISALTRSQAASAERSWIRTKVRLVKWPGLPPMADGKKVDICPSHASMVMTVDEYKAKKKAEREEKRAAKKSTAPKKRELAQSSAES